MSAADDGKGSAQVLRALNMLEHLCGHAVRGQSNKDIAAALRCPPSYVTRTAETLIQKGWVEKDEESGRFCITSRFSRLVHRVDSAFESEASHLADLKRNYTLTN